MKKEELFNDDFLKQFKSGDELNGFLKEPNEKAAKAALEDFAQKWEGKYSYAIRSWRDNWDELTVFYEFPVEI